MGANAGLDLTFEVPGLQLGQYHHPRQTKIAAGGAKGVNTAKVLRRLGRDVRAVGFAGGHVGTWMKDLLAADGITSDLVPIAGASRLCLNFVDPQTGTQTQVDEIGPGITSEEALALHQQWQASLAGASLALIAGAPPPGLDPASYAGFVQAARAAGVPVFVDARDAALTAAVSAGPDLMKPNQAEFARLVGRDLPTVAAVAAAAAELVTQGVGTVVVSLGTAGAVAVDPDGAWLAQTPPVAAVSAVGSGDAMMAGLVHAYLQGLPLPEQLRWGVAAGAANAAVLGACFVDAPAILETVATVVVTKLGWPCGEPL